MLSRFKRLLYSHRARPVTVAATEPAPAPTSPVPTPSEPASSPQIVQTTTFPAPPKTWISSLPGWDGTRAPHGRQTADYPASAHARFLVNWLTENDTWTDAGLLFSTVSAAYHSMCSSTGLDPRPWNTVGSEFRALTGSKKSYLWVTLPDGRHRLRVYRQPAAPNGVDSIACRKQLGFILDIPRRRAA